jgi:antitoxin component YwqK of YwqJK toxin-antitoxin module
LKSGSGIYTYASGNKYDGCWDKDKRHGIGEFRWARGEIYKGSWANNNRHGIGLEWYPSGDFFQGTHKDDKRDGLFIIHFKASGNTADVEYQDGLKEGLWAEHKSGGVTWYTHSKG